MRNAVFGQHGHSLMGDDVGQTVVDLGIDMIRPTCQHHTVNTVFFDVFDGFLAFFADIVFKSFVFGVSLLGGRGDLFFGNIKIAECFGQSGVESVFFFQC